MPCYNERAHVQESLQSLLTQDYDRDFEILVIDGGSTDGTRDLVQAMAGDKVILVDNPRRTAPYALNLGIPIARGRYILRADAHAIYPRSYVGELVRYLSDESIGTVGGVVHTLPGDGSSRARAVAYVLGSKFGVGWSFRSFVGTTAREVDTVPFGAWRRELFDEVGRFDESLVRGQDLEFNVRLRQFGKKVVCLPWLRVGYYAREEFSKLARMSWQYGYWKTVVNRKHHLVSSFRQIFPPLLVLQATAGLTASLLVPGLGVWGNAGILVYGVAAAVAAVRGGIKSKRGTAIPGIWWCFFVSHFCYGAGYLAGLAELLLLPKRHGRRASRPTR